MKDIKYYEISREASSHIGDNQGLITIAQLASKSNDILDVGCGEGTRLNLFTGKKARGTGVDINSYAIAKSKKQFPRLHFLRISGEKLPFPSNSFDFAYSTFVLEHTQNPPLFIQEMIRVTKIKGKILILCPNYGSPNRRSPVSIEKPLVKLIFGFIKDLLSSNNQITFTKVIPKRIFKNPDDDTTCEPYLNTLIRYLSQDSSLKIERASSLWEIDANITSLHQKIFKLLGQMKIYPFKYWGPQLFVVIKKLK